MNNWSDYPIFLAVAETGSLTAAGEQLGISQPTVGRRMKALEQRFGAPLLTKEEGRLSPTEFGYLVLDHVRRMEAEADAITRSSATLEHSLVGPVMITATEGVGDFWLPAVMQRFRKDNPDIVIDVNVANHALNLAQREADIALRWMGPGTQNSLIGRRVTSFGFGLYASQEYLERKGVPSRPEDLLDHDGVRFNIGQETLWPLDKAGNFTPMPRTVFRTNNLMAHCNAIFAGYGIGMLSHAAHASDMGLIRVLPDLVREEDLWVVAHEDLKKSARVRAAFDFIIDALRKDEAHFKTGAASVFIEHTHPTIASTASGATTGQAPADNQSYPDIAKVKFPVTAA
ncbi:MAG: LysR family transcriptional regulator [Robiginitomaculum sp.]|nr:LysR family transcriptional regulator [Robiginitomaculum sp.]